MQLFNYLTTCAVAVSNFLSGIDNTVPDTPPNPKITFEPSCSEDAEHRIMAGLSALVHHFEYTSTRCNIDREDLEDTRNITKSEPLQWWAPLYHKANLIHLEKRVETCDNLEHFVRELLGPSRYRPRELVFDCKSFCADPDWFAYTHAEVTTDEKINICPRLLQANLGFERYRRWGRFWTGGGALDLADTDSKGETSPLEVIYELVDKEADYLPYLVVSGRRMRQLRTVVMCREGELVDEEAWPSRKL